MIQECGDGWGGAIMILYNTFSGEGIHKISKKHSTDEDYRLFCIVVCIMSVQLL